jgi:hypothetical protein
VLDADYGRIILIQAPHAYIGTSCCRTAGALVSHKQMLGRLAEVAPSVTQQHRLEEHAPECCLVTSMNFPADKYRDTVGVRHLLPSTTRHAPPCAGSSCQQGPLNSNSTTTHVRISDLEAAGRTTAAGLCKTYHFSLGLQPDCRAGELEGQRCGLLSGLLQPCSSADDTPERATDGSNPGLPGNWLATCCDAGD